MAGKVSADFVEQMFKSPIVIKQIENSSAGTTVGTYTITGANKTILPFPSDRKEQELVGQLLADIDLDITGLLVRLNKTQQLKQGMMQELLTGKTRLV
jgi:type I restriction enzyme S subunit